MSKVPVVFRIHYLSKIVAVCSLLFFTFASFQAQASSADAWQEYQQEVEQACRDAANASFMVRVALVDPYGSESFGYAVLIGMEQGATKESLVVCAYDLAAQKAEISGAFEL